MALAASRLTRSAESRGAYPAYLPLLNDKLLGGEIFYEVDLRISNHSERPFCAPNLTFVPPIPLATIADPSRWRHGQVLTLNQAR
jgi:hypothetical protein